MKTQNNDPLAGPLSDATPEQFEQWAVDVGRDESIAVEHRWMMAVAFRTAARWKQDAEAFNRYLRDEHAATALLARRYVSTPNVAVEDRRESGRGFVVLIQEGDSMRSCIEG